MAKVLEFQDNLKIHIGTAVGGKAAARRHYRGLTWLGCARRAGGAPEGIYLLSNGDWVNSASVFFMPIPSIRVPLYLTLEYKPLLNTTIHKDRIFPKAC